MIKKIIFIFVLTVLNSGIALAAEKIPMQITPAQIISTEHDEVEYGDIIDFKVAKDVYNEDRIIIKKDAPIEGEVDYVSPNGWAADSAYIQFKHFKVLTANNNSLDINYTLKIKGSDCMKSSNPFYKGYFMAKSLFRGSEVYLEPNQRNFNIFLIY